MALAQAEHWQDVFLGDALCKLSPGRRTHKEHAFAGVCFTSQKRGALAAAGRGVQRSPLQLVLLEHQGAMGSG